MLFVPRIPLPPRRSWTFSLRGLLLVQLAIAVILIPAASSPQFAVLIVLLELIMASVMLIAIALCGVHPIIAATIFWATILSPVLLYLIETARNSTYVWRLLTHLFGQLNSYAPRLTLADVTVGLTLCAVICFTLGSALGWALSVSNHSGNR